MSKIATIGVVAGAGPYAGLDLIKKIFDNTLAEKDQDHINVIGNFKAAELTDRTAFLYDNTLPNPGDAIAAQVLETEGLGASVAGIPCNTAHSPQIIDRALDRLHEVGSRVTFVNMIRETVIFVQQRYPGLHTIGVLSTTGTARTGIYRAYFGPAGFTVLQLPDDEQETLVHAAIYDKVYGVKAAGYGTEQARANFLTAARSMLARGAQAIVLGCTEIPIAITEAEIDGAPTIDPTRVLARALIREAAPDKLKPLN